MICEDKSEIDVAIKAPLAFFRSEIIQSVYEEIRRQTKFSHENVVKCLGFYHNKTQQYPVLILEWMFYGSLAKVFERSKLQKALYLLLISNTCFSEIKIKIQILLSHQVNSLSNYFLKNLKILGPLQASRFWQIR